MSKLISPAMRNALSERHGTEPIIVVRIKWGGTSFYYATKIVEDAGIYCNGIIKTVGEISNSKKADNSCNTASVELEFFDTDGQFKNVMDVQELEGTTATVYQHFNGLYHTDWMPLVHGRICRPKWTEGNRAFSCTIETVVISDEIGFAPTPDDFNDLATEAYGIPWPLLFGKVAMSPCVHVRRKVEGQLKTAIQLKSDICKFNADGTKIVWVEPEEIKTLSFYDLATVTENKIFVKDGNKFPQGISLKIIIDEVIFQGSFSGDEFTVTASNVRKYPAIALGPRPPAIPPIPPFPTNGDVDAHNFHVAWLKDTKPYPSLVGCHVYLAGEKGHKNIVVKQEKNKLWFKFQTLDPDSYFPALWATGVTLKDIFPINRSGILGRHEARSIYRQDLFRLRKATIVPAVTTGSGLADTMNRGFRHHGNSFWSAESGTKVRIYDGGEDPDIYIISLNTVQQVYSVYGRKTIKIGQHSYKTFAPIPTAWYTEQLLSNYQIKGQTASALLFDLPLSDHDTETEKWDDVIYCSCQSTIGPNTADIIKWILQTYTDYEIDEPSFTHVHDQLVYNSNFGIYDRRDALQIAQDIAWQARCALRVDSEVIELIYIAEEPNSLGTIAENLVQFKSLELKTSESVGLTTRLVGTWRESMEWTEAPTKDLNQDSGKELRRIIRAIRDTERRETPSTKYVLHTENIDKYGLKTDTREIYIYNEEEPVQKTIDFWGHRMANCWRMVSFKTTLQNLNAQTWDCIHIALDILGPVKGIIENVRYDSKEKDVMIEMWLPVIVGQESVDAEAWNG